MGVRFANSKFTIDSVTEVVATALAGVTGSIRSSAQDGCRVDLDNVAEVRELPPVHWNLAGHAVDNGVGTAGASRAPLPELMRSSLVKNTRVFLLKYDQQQSFSSSFSTDDQSTVAAFLVLLKL